MSFILKEPNTFINIKLTDAGRRMMASGNFNMDRAVLLDREIDYSIDDTGYYNIFDNRIINPADYHPDVAPFNLDGTPAFKLDNHHVTTQKLVITAQTTNSGFFTGSMNNWTLDTTQIIGRNHITYATNTVALTQRKNYLTLDNGGGTTFPKVGELLFIPWVHDTTIDYMTSSQAVPPIYPVLCCWYKVISAATPVVILDRPITGSQNGASTSCFIYPNNGIENFYGSANTQTTKVWNMNIVRTNNILGTKMDVSGNTNYTRYGSIEYAGTRNYFGFGNEIPAVGFVHYTNENTGNTYGEQFVEQSFEMYLPMIMWHHNNNFNGSGRTWGAEFYDYYGQTKYDAIAKSSFRDLKDSRDASGITVGRVYHKLKLIIITDQELLNVLSYKSNRNYSLPDFSISLSDKPKNPLNTSQATGLCRSGYTYFVSYVPATTGYSASISALSYGHPPAVPCGYIKKIEGQTDSYGNPTYLNLNFPNANSFPYMRGPDNWLGGGGTIGLEGWNAWTMQVLVNEQLTSIGYDVANVPCDEWRKMSDITIGGNGVYSCFNEGDATIVPGKLNNFSFVMSREDYVSGSTYVLPSGITYSMDSLNFGNEYFFHGVIRTAIMSTAYKTSIMVTANNTQLNSSNNSSYDKQLHSEIFVTEIAVIDKSGQVVAVGKPTYPIRKFSGKYLGFKLEIDF